MGSAMAHIYCGLLALLVCRPSAAKPETAFQEKVETVEVISVVGGRASLPCDLTPPFPSDEPHLILFYKDVYGTPIYSYDMRQSSEKGRHWKDNRTLGNRAFFHYKETGMRSETGAMQIASFLTIEALRPDDSGFYRCRVDFKEAPTKNTKILLKLIVPPSSPLIRSEHGKILDKVSEPVQEGSTLTLICETQGGEPLPRLTWKRGQVVLDDVIEEVDTQNRVVRNYLKMPSLHRRDHGDVLACLASNTNLSAPEITYININMVFPPVQAKIVREWTFFSAGQAYNVSCQVLGSRPPAVTAIYVGPSQLREVNYNVSPDGNVSTTTVIFIPDESDQGKFLSCRAENVQLSSSAVEDQWKLEIHYTPRVTLKMSSTLEGDLIRKGDTVYLECDVKANPPAHTIKWTFNGKLINPKESNVHRRDESLIIRGVHEGNNGVYQCAAKNQVGQSVSNTQSLNVKSFPSCANTELETFVQVERHEATQLKCQYHSSSGGPLEFRWSMNSSHDSVDFPKSQFTSEGDKSVLSFSAKTDLDFGTTISCLAVDAVGQALRPCTFQIVQKGEPSALRNCSAVNQTFESLSIVCMNSSLNNDQQKYILEVRNSRNDDMVVNISTNQPVFHVRGLSSGTEYRVRIYSVNGDSKQTVQFETFTLQPAEKQLAATTTDLASNNPMKLLPIVAVLIAIVLSLVILAVIFVIIIRGRNNCANSPPSNATSTYQQRPLAASDTNTSLDTTTVVNSNNARIRASPSSHNYRQKHHHQLASELNSPDLILPASAASKGFSQHSISSHQSYEELLLASQGSDPSGVGSNCGAVVTGSLARSSIKKSIMKKPPSSGSVLTSDCQYAQLVFDNRHSSFDDSVLYMSSPQQRYHQGQTNYATIDHSRRKTNSSKIGRQKELMHSASCPFKGDPQKKGQQQQPSNTSSLLRNNAGGPGSRSGTLKRVAFKDEQTVHEDVGASSIRLIPSTLSDGEPVPAPPPGYESGFPIVVDVSDEMLTFPTHQTSSSTTTVAIPPGTSSSSSTLVTNSKQHQQDKCSNLTTTTTSAKPNDLVSRL